MSADQFSGCLVPTYLTGPCNQSVIQNTDGRVLYNATAPYIGPPAASSYSIRNTNGTVLYNATDLCMWVVPFDADPDIAGLGVILAFLIFSWFSFITTIFTIFFVQKSAVEDLLNDFDHMLIRYASILRRFVLRWKTGQYPSPGISKEACCRALIMLSDQQLVTGTAILLVSFAKHKVMTQYHFEITCTLAWMAYAAHDTITVAALGYIRAHPEMRWWRALWISVLFPMLFVSQLVTFHDKFLLIWGNSIQCIWNDMDSGYPRVSLFMLVVLVLMTYGYINTMYSLYPEYMSWVEVVGYYVSWAFRLPGKLYLIVKSRHEASPQPWKRVWFPLKIITYLLFVLFISTYQIVGSTLFSTIRLYIVLIWGTMYLVHLRSQASREGLQGSENDWGFGQILPTVLLALIIFGIVEVYHRDFLNSKMDNDNLSQEAQVTRSDTLSEANVKPTDSLTSLEESLLGLTLYKLFLVVSAAVMLAWFTKIAVVDGYVF